MRADHPAASVKVEVDPIDVLRHNDPDRDVAGRPGNRALLGLIEIGLGLGKLGFVADLLASEVQVGTIDTESYRREVDDLVVRLEALHQAVAEIRTA